MSKQFDIDLKNHISEVFENYEDLSADAGWQLLREKFPEKKKDRAIIWWYSIAAGLLLFAVLFFLQDKNTETVAVHRHVKINKNEVIAKITSPPNNHPSPASKNNNELTGRNVPSNAGSPYKVYTHQHKNPALNRSFAAAQFYNPPPAVPEKAIEKPSMATTENHRATLAVADSGNKHVLAKTTEATVMNTPSKPPVTNTNTDPVLKMMAGDKAKQADKAVLKETRKKESVIALSPYAATYFNYAKGSSNQVNVGAGVTTDFKVSGKLKFSTGIAIAQNTLSFNNSNIPQKAASTTYAYVIVSSPVSSGTQSNPANQGFYLNNYKANLIGLDIPINLKYQVSPVVSVSAGVSSGSFINESYTTTIYNGTNNINLAFASNQHFGTFDFAKTVNLSFGLGYPIGGNHITVEPFLKYPIGGLGSQNLKFGASGLNLKFNFSTIKK